MTPPTAPAEIKELTSQIVIIQEHLNRHNFQNGDGSKILNDHKSSNSDGSNHLNDHKTVNGDGSNRLNDHKTADCDGSNALNGHNLRWPNAVPRAYRSAIAWPN